MGNKTEPLKSKFKNTILEEYGFGNEEEVNKNFSNENSLNNKNTLKNRIVGIEGPKPKTRYQKIKSKIKRRVGHAGKTVKKGINNFIKNRITRRKRRANTRKTNKTNKKTKSKSNITKKTKS